MAARLRAKKLWSYVDGSFKNPGASSDQYHTWKLAYDAAAGELFGCLEKTQWAYVSGLEDAPDKMWDALEVANFHKKAGTRFNAYDELFGLRKKEEETLMEFGAGAQGATANVVVLWPAGFDIVMVDQEMTVMAML